MSVAERPTRAATGHLRWALLALLFLLASLAYVQRLNFQIASEAMLGDLGLTLEQMGWVFAAFSWGYALFQVPGGALGVRFGFRLPLLILGLTWGVLTLLVGFVPASVSTGAIVALLVGLRLAMGIAQAPYFPLQAGVVERWFPPAGWALPNGLVTAGLSFGAAATAPVVAWLMGSLGWRASFWLLAPVGLPVLALWWWIARDDPAEHPRIAAGELAIIAAGRAPHAAIGSGEPPTRGVGRALLRLLADRRVVALTASYFAGNYVYYMFFQWLFLYLVQERGFGVLASGFLAALPWITGAVTGGLGGAVCDVLCKRLGPTRGCRLTAMVPLVFVALLLPAGAGAASPALAVTCLTLCFGAHQFTDASYWSASTYVAGRETAAATGILNTGGNLPGILTGVLTPLIIAGFGWWGAFVVGSAFSLAAALLWLMVDLDPTGSPPGAGV